MGRALRLSRRHGGTQGEHHRRGEETPRGDVRCDTRARCSRPGTRAAPESAPDRGFVFERCADSDADAICGTPLPDSPPPTTRREHRHAQRQPVPLVQAQAGRVLPELAQLAGVAEAGARRDGARRRFISPNRAVVANNTAVVARSGRTIGSFDFPPPPPPPPPPPRRPRSRIALPDSPATPHEPSGSEPAGRRAKAGRPLQAPALPATPTGQSPPGPRPPPAPRRRAGDAPALPQKGAAGAPRARLARVPGRRASARAAAAAPPTSPRASPAPSPPETPAARDPALLPPAADGGGPARSQGVSRGGERDATRGRRARLRRQGAGRHRVPPRRPRDVRPPELLRAARDASRPRHEPMAEDSSDPAAAPARPPRPRESPSRSRSPRSPRTGTAC